MRRYTLDIRDRTLTIDIEELAADRFHVIVDGETYEVRLAGDEDLPEAAITPVLTPARSGAEGQAPAESAAQAVHKAFAPRATASPPSARRAAGGGTGVLSAPMPGVILDVAVKPGDTVVRGQEIAVLEAMKMQNSIRSPRAGTIAEVCVAAGQAIGHGDAIIRYTEG
jgi:biotin carboxyl carrier protein